MFKYIAYFRKDPLYLSFENSNALIISRFECGIDISPNPKDNEDFEELESEKCIVFPSEIDGDGKALLLKCKK